MEECTQQYISAYLNQPKYHISLYDHISAPVRHIGLAPKCGQGRISNTATESRDKADPLHISTAGKTHNACAYAGI